MARRRTAAGKVDARIPPFPCRTSSDVTRPFRNKSGTALKGQEEGFSGVGGEPSPWVFFLLEVVAVADASVQRAGPVPDVRVPVHVDGSLRSYRHAQSGSQLQRRRSLLRPPSRFARSRGCPAERRSFPLSGLPGPAPRLRGFPPALLVRRCCCLPGPFISK